MCAISALAAVGKLGPASAFLERLFRQSLVGFLLVAPRPIMPIGVAVSPWWWWRPRSYGRVSEPFSGRRSLRNPSFTIPARLPFTRGTHITWTGSLSARLTRRARPPTNWPTRSRGNSCARARRGRSTGGMAAGRCLGSHSAGTRRCRDVRSA